MNNFGNTLSAILAANSITQSDFSRLSGIDVPSLSRFATGKQSPANKALTKLLEAIPGGSRSRAQLAKAWLMDELDRMPLSSALVSIDIDESEVFTAAFDSESSDLLRRAARLLRENPEFKELLRQLVSVLEPDTTLKAAEQKGNYGSSRPGK